MKKTRFRIHLPLQDVISDYLMLTRPRVVLMVLVTTYVGSYLGSSAELTQLTINSTSIIQMWQKGR